MFHLPSTKSSYIHLEGFERPAVEPPVLPEPLVVRRVTARDAAAVRTLAYLDDCRLPEGPFLVAELGGEIVAAISIPTGVAMADPFRRTRDAVDMLRLRAAQLAEPDQVGSRNPRGKLKPATAG